MFICYVSQVPSLLPYIFPRSLESLDPPLEAQVRAAVAHLTDGALRGRLEERYRHFTAMYASKEDVAGTWLAYRMVLAVLALAPQNR